MKLSDKLTIIIPHLGATKEQKYSLNETLKSLHETAKDIKKIIVCNGGNNVKHFGRVNETYMDIPWQGQCKSVNSAAAVVNTEWIMISNDDMIFSKGWTYTLDRYIKMVRNDVDDFGSVATLSPILIESRDGAPTFKVANFGGAGGDFDKDAFDKYVDNNKRVNVYGHDSIDGFNFPLIIKKEVWDLIGGYDINYDPWGSNSDSDLLYKIKLAGFSSKQMRDFPVYHFSQTSGTFHPDNNKYWHDNMKYFREKWGFHRIGSPEIWTTDFKIDYNNLTYLPLWITKK